MAATLPVNSVWTRKFYWCLLSLPAWRRIHNLASQSSPRLGESFSVAIGLHLQLSCKHHGPRGHEEVAMITPHAGK